MFVHIILSQPSGQESEIVALQIMYSDLFQHNPPSNDTAFVTLYTSCLFLVALVQ